MIYPNNFEQKIGFNEIRALLNERCQSTLGKEKVAEMQFSKDAGEISEWLCQIKDFRFFKIYHHCKDLKQSQIGMIL